MGRGLKVAGIALVLILLILGYLGIADSDKNDSNSDNGIVHIDIVEESQSLQEIVNKRVEEGMINIHINTDIKMKSSRDKAKLMIQNIETNKYTQQIDIVDSNNELVYSSANIKPGYKIEMDYIEKDLAVGKHKCMANINILESDGLDRVNTLHIPIEITIEN